CIQVAIVCRSWPLSRKRSKQLGSRPKALGSRLMRIPWLWEYCPVRMDAREGQHRGVVANPLVKVRPRSISIDFRLGMRSMLATSRSSASRNTMFGRQVGVGVGERAGATAVGEGTGVVGVDP